MTESHDNPPGGLRESATFDRNVIHEIQRAARTGIYDIRGWGAKRRVPHFDDLVFLGASMSRYPLEGYRERCDTGVDQHSETTWRLAARITTATTTNANSLWATSLPEDSASV